MSQNQFYNLIVAIKSSVSSGLGERLDQMANRRACGVGVLHRLPHVQCSLEPGLQLFQLADLFLIFLYAFFDDLANHWARRIAMHGVVKNILDLSERKSEVLCRLDKFQSLLIGRFIDLVAVSQVTRWF